VLEELRRVILGLRVQNEDEEVESLYDRMKLDIKNTRDGVITMWGEEEEASLWRDRDTGPFLDVMCGWVRNAKNYENSVR
jgi:hypothetical protein